ncbi:MAG: ABC transporter ATP-binding protein [Anaerolineales bacterium]
MSKSSSKEQSAPARGPMLGGRRIEKAKDVRGTLRRLTAYLRPFSGTLFLVSGLVLVGTLMSLVGPYLLGRAIDDFIATGDAPGLLRLALLMLGAYLLAWLAQAGQNYLMAGVAQKALRNLRRDLFEHLQILSLRFFDRNPAGELMSRLTNDIDAVNQAVSENLTQMLGSLFTLVGVVIAMFSINLWLALGTLTILPLMVGLVGFVGKRTRVGYRRLQGALGELNGIMEESFSGARVVLAFGQQEATLARFDATNAAVRDFGIKAQVYPMLIPPLMGILSNANIAVVAGLGGWLTLQGLAGVGQIATFVSYSRQFAAPLRQLGDLYNQIQAALAGAERVFEVLDETPEMADAPDAPALEGIRGEVVFDDVDFSYVEGTPVIKGMSLRAEPGQIVALVGPTGAGKTTIINLLTRFYDIDGGRITIDGQDIRRVQKASLRRQLGIVLQDTFLFTGSVLENIRYGRLDATEEEVVAAARLANADQFIRRLPQGYATELSERGSNLSQGQRQLLAIARAVLADPRILILDEATSSVDTRTEAQIQTALLKLMEGRTSFVIAHRLSTIRDADQVLVIDGGEIIERGTHETLLAARGFYYNLYMSQFRGEAEVAVAVEVV